MSFEYTDNAKTVAEFKKSLINLSLPDFTGLNLGRDSLVNYCIDNELVIFSEKYPSSHIFPSFQSFMNEADGNDKSNEDYEEFHNYKFVVAFSNAIEDMGYRSIKVYYECFQDEPRARCFDVPIPSLPVFLEQYEVPIYFLDDTLFFSPDYKFGMCIFHHELIEFYGFGDSSKMIHELCMKRLDG